jgi:hypothetical protein
VRLWTRSSATAFHSQCPAQSKHMQHRNRYINCRVRQNPAADFVSGRPQPTGKRGQDKEEICTAGGVALSAGSPISNTAGKLTIVPIREVVVVTRSLGSYMRPFT